jgi:hypothetical protein
VWTSGWGFLIRRIGDAIQADHALSRNRARAIAPGHLENDLETGIAVGG